LRYRCRGLPRVWAPSRNRRQASSSEAPGPSLA
jgi:hypothetical protein